MDKKYFRMPMMEVITIDNEIICTSNDESCGGNNEMEEFPIIPTNG